MPKISDILNPSVKAKCCSSEDSLSSLTHRLDTPTSAVFVCEDERLVGIISPHQLFYNNRSLPSTKVAQVMTQPPRITVDDDLQFVAELMANEQIFCLPVCDEKRVIGYVDIHAIKSVVHKEKDELNIAKNIRIRTAITISQEDDIRSAISIMKHHGNEWLVVTNQNNQPTGIVHVGHLLSIMLLDDQKQRFGKNRIPWTNWAFDTEPDEIIDRKISNLIIPDPTPVITKVDENRILDELLTTYTNAVVLVEDNVISGIATIRDLCDAYARSAIQDEVNISIKRPSASVSDHEYLRAQEELRRFVNKMQKRLPIQRIEVGVEEPKYATQQTAIYNTAVTVIPYTKGSYYAQGHEKIFSYSIRSALKQIEKQHQRDHQEDTNYDMPSMGEITKSESLS